MKPRAVIPSFVFGLGLSHLVALVVVAADSSPAYALLDAWRNDDSLHDSVRWWTIAKHCALLLLGLWVVPMLAAWLAIEIRAAHRRATPRIFDPRFGRQRPGTSPPWERCAASSRFR